MGLTGTCWAGESCTTPNFSTGATAITPDGCCEEWFWNIMLFSLTYSQFSPSLGLQEAIFKSYKGIFGVTSWTHKPFAAFKQFFFEIITPKPKTFLALSHKYPESTEAAIAPKTKGRFLCQKEKKETHSRIISQSSLWENTLKCFNFISDQLSQGRDLALFSGMEMLTRFWKHLLSTLTREMKAPQDVTLFGIDSLRCTQLNWVHTELILE